MGYCPYQRWKTWGWKKSTSGLGCIMTITELEFFSFSSHWINLWFSFYINTFTRVPRATQTWQSPLPRYSSAHRLERYLFLNFFFPSLSFGGMIGVFQILRKRHILRLSGTTGGFIHHLPRPLLTSLGQNWPAALIGSPPWLIATHSIIVGDLVFSLIYRCHRGYWSQRGISKAGQRIVM